MRCAILLTACLLLTGCLSDQKKTEAQCELDARRAYPAENFFISTRTYDHLLLCMQAAGYERTFAKKGYCPTFVAYQPACYRPSEFLSGILFDLEMMLQ
jgi:hypothetical protein